MDLFLDFETYSESSIKDIGGYLYTNHPSTKLLCMATAVDNDPVQIWTPGMRFPADLFENADRIIAHNASFERHVVRNVLKMPVDQYQWVCTAVMATFNGLPRSLELCAEALGYAKDMDGSAVMKKLCAPGRDGKQVNDPAMMQTLYNYCIKDVDVCRGLYQTMHHMALREWDWFAMDQRINEHGILIDKDTCKRVVAMAGDIASLLDDQAKELTNGELESTRQVGTLKKWLSARGIELPSVAASLVEEQLARPDLDPVVRAVLLNRQQTGKSSVAKYASMLKRLFTDGRVRDAVMFYGAHTGRWAGRGVQFQNLPRPSMKDPTPYVPLLQKGTVNDIAMICDNPMTVLADCIRPMIIAPRRKVLIVVDFAQIEARMVSWMAGETSLLKGFASGVDVYKIMAKIIYDLDSVDDVTSDQRFVGKQAILGLGYGMGPIRFQAQCAQYGQFLTPELCNDTVKIYRAYFSNIQRLWGSLHGGFQSCLKHGRSRQAHNVVRDEEGYKIPDGYGDWVRDKSGIYYQFDLYQLVADAHSMQFSFHNGTKYKRAINYWKPEVRMLEPDEMNNKAGGVNAMTYLSPAAGGAMREVHTHGGKLAENMSQALSRDVMAQAIARLEKAGHKVAFHVHDEVILEGLPGELDEVVSIIEDSEDWLAGCPIKAEGFETERYRKE